MDLRVQSYKGEDVLTFFTGVFSGGGYANGSVRRCVSSLAVFEKRERYWS
jgi:hypothetical protein